MEVKFLKDFRGKETEEVFYKAGEVAAVKDHHAAHLIELGFAEEWKGAETVVFESLEPVVAPEAKIVPPEIKETDKSIFAQPEERPVQPFEVEETEEESRPAKKRKAKK